MNKNKLTEYESKAPVVVVSSGKLIFLGSKIGEGSFAHVFEGRTQEGVPVAVKAIQKARLTPQLDQFLRREMAIVRELRHPNIIAVSDVCENPDTVHIVMRLASSDLLQHVNERAPIDETEARYLFAQLVAAMRYTHAAGVVHRDLKLENILLTYHNGDVATPSVYVADWGFATRYDWTKATLTERVGSLSYCAPELLLGQTYVGPEIDVWSMGVILYAMLFGQLPFSQPDQNLRRKYIACGFYTIPPSASSRATRLIQHMLTVDPARRATLADVLQHSWMRKSPRPPRPPVDLSEPASSIRSSSTAAAATAVPVVSTAESVDRAAAPVREKSRREPSQKDVSQTPSAMSGSDSSFSNTSNIGGSSATASATCGQRPAASAAAPSMGGVAADFNLPSRSDSLSSATTPMAQCVSGGS